MPALTPELQAPQKTFGFNLSFWKLCLEARRIRNEERRLNICEGAKKAEPIKEVPPVRKAGASGGSN